MSAAALKDLLARIREDPAFNDLLALLDGAGNIKVYRLTGEPLPQIADWIFQSGCQFQARRVKELLTGYQPQTEENHERRAKPATRG
jgi:hypothetical protein